MKIAKTLRDILLLAAFAAATSACGQTSLVSGYNTQATFEDIYNGKYDGYSVIYEGIPYNYEYSSDFQNLTIYFKDDATGRKFYAYCEADCYHLPVSVAVGFLNDSEKDSLPIRVYGLQQGHSLSLDVVSVLLGQDRWENLDVGSASINNYRAPTPGGN